MDEAIAEASKEKLENDPRVEKAEIKENEKGIYVEAEATDRLAARNLQSDLNDYAVYIEVVS